LFLINSPITGRFIQKQFCLRNHDTFKVGRDKWGMCRECSRQHSRKWHDANRDYLNAKRKEHYYNTDYDRNANWARAGIINSDGTPFTKVNFDRFYQMQSGGCKICLRHQSEIKKALVVDHDHRTGFARGLVCQGCNIKIGSIESKEFSAVLRYLNLEVH
jgi:Recombination endonuclease VII